MPNLTAFISYVLITTFMPGPNNIMSMSIASSYGFKKVLDSILAFFVVFSVL